MNFKWTFRAIAYTAVLFVLLGFMSFLLISRTDVSATVLRTPGMLYQKLDDGKISNLYNYKIINKTNRDMPLEFRLLNEKGELKMVGSRLEIEGQGMTEGSLFLVFDREDIVNKKMKVKLGIFNGDEQIATVSTTFIGP
jgi:hypothetical protein